MSAAMSGERVHGRCLCEAVSFSATLRNDEMAVCHCGMCRRWTGGVLMFVSLEAEGLDVQGADSLSWYRSSEIGERGFCRTCGTSLFWRAVDGASVEVSPQALDHPERFRFTTEIWLGDKPANYSFADETRKSLKGEAWEASGG